MPVTEPTRILVEVRQTTRQALGDTDDVTVECVVEWPWPDPVSGRDFTIYRYTHRARSEVEAMQEIARAFGVFGRYLQNRDEETAA